MEKKKTKDNREKIDKFQESKVLITLILTPVAIKESRGL